MTGFEKAYAARKQSESSFLNSLAGFSGDSPRFQGVERLLEFKFRVRDQIHRSYEGGPHGESNLARKERVSAGGFRFRYEYQRLGLFLDSANPLKELYPDLAVAKGTRSSGFFVNSCQGAIAAFFHTMTALSSRGRVRRGISNRHGAYWETTRFLELTLELRSLSEGHEIVYLDSSTLPADGVDFDFTKELKASLESAKILAVDTTCYPRDSKILSEILRVSRDSDVPCFLLRSHMKLDSLGMEYGRLGSAVLVWAPSFPKRIRDFCRRFEETYVSVAQTHGTFASLRQIYPFLNSRRFRQINRGWLRAVRNCNDEVVSGLEARARERGDDYTLHTFQHGFYSWISFPRAFEEIERHKLGERLHRFLRFYEVPFRSVASYPWDVLGFTLFSADLGLTRARGKRGVIRISAGDLDVQARAGAVRAVDAWLSSLRRRR